MWKLRLGREGTCWATWLVSHQPLCPDPAADHTRSLMWKKGRMGVSLPQRHSSALRGNAVLHSARQAPRSDPGALAHVRNPLQAREWSYWPQWPSHHVLSSEKKNNPQNRVISNAPPSLQLLSCWCGGQEKWRDGEGGAARLSEDKSLVPLQGRQDHICHSSWQCRAPIPLLPQSCHGVQHCRVSRRQKLQSAEGKLRVNFPAAPTADVVGWWERRDEVLHHRQSCSSALPQPDFEGTGG